MDNKLKVISLPVTYEIDDSFDSDKFIKLRLRVMHNNVNPNMSSFTDEVIDNAKESIKNIPLLAHVVIDENGQPQFGAHDFHIEEDKMNPDNYRIIYDESPIGTIPETNNYDYSEFEGRNYVFTDCYVWKDYSNYSQAIIERDQNIKLSMEILIDSYSYDSSTDVYTINAYRYQGITLLGNNYGTGMIDAMATTGAFSQENKAKFVSLMAELKQELTHNQSSSEVDDKSNKSNFSKKEVKQLTDIEKDEIFKKYNLTINDIDFEIKEDMSKDELDAKLKEFSVGDKLGTGDKIDIDNTKDSAKNSDSWKNPKVSFLNKCLKASNHEALVKEGYAVVPDDASGDLSINDVGYPHHDIVDGKMIVDVAGVEAAYKRACQQGLTGAPMDHIQKHRKELGLDTEDSDDNSDDVSKSSKKEGDKTKEKTKAKTTEVKETEGCKKQKNSLNYSATYQDKRNALNNALPSTSEVDDDGNIISQVSYWVCDFTDDSVFVEKDIWSATDGFDSINGKFSYTFDDTTVTATITSDFVQMYLVWLTADEKAVHDAQDTNYSKLEKEFSTYKDTYKTSEVDVEKLREFKNERLDKDRQNDIDAIFAKTEFKSLIDNEEFKTFKENVGDMKLEDIETKCYAILGKSNSKADFSAKTKETVKIAVPVSDDSADELYGGLFSKYKNNK